MMEQYRIDENKGLEIGLYTLGDHVADALTGKPISERQRIQEIITAAKLAEDAGLDVFGVGRVISRNLLLQQHRSYLEL